MAELSELTPQTELDDTGNPADAPEPAPTGDDPPFLVNLPEEASEPDVETPIDATAQEPPEPDKQEPADPTDGPQSDSAKSDSAQNDSAQNDSPQSDSAQPATVAPNEKYARFAKSSSVLRISPELFEAARSIAYVQLGTHVTVADLAHPPSANELAALAPLLIDEHTMEPMAADLLQIVNQASLIVSVELSYDDDVTNPVLWATPRRGIATTSATGDFMEMQPVAVTQLPQVIGQLIVHRAPRFVNPTPISLPQSALVEAVAMEDEEEAIKHLIRNGIEVEDAELVLELQRPTIRRWRISSSWSSNDGTEFSELAGIDADAHGQWLATGAQAPDGSIMLTYVPQSDGDVFKALRQVLPRHWTSKPLNPAKLKVLHAAAGDDTPSA